MSSLPYTPITENPVPALSIEQLEEYSLESIHAERVAAFDPSVVAEVLREKEGTRVIGADFGGDKGAVRLYVVRGGRLEIDETYEDRVQGTYGEGYLGVLERLSEFASTHNIPVGMSWGAPLDGTRPQFHQKAATLLEELGQRYEGDFKNVVPNLTACINDGPAGLISAVVAAARQGPVENVILPINGGGLGMAVLANGTLFATEAGHVRGVGALNTYGQTTVCGVFGAEYTCIEMLGANKVGIEAQWAMQHEPLRALDIENEFKAGNEFAGELYDHSAWVISHVIVGTAQAFGIDLTRDTTAIVGHGGAWRFPDYNERVRQIIGQHIVARPRLMTTFDYGDARSNACIEGAALAALIGL